MLDRVETPFGEDLVFVKDLGGFWDEYQMNNEEHLKNNEEQ